MPAKVHTQTPDSPVARLTAFIHWTTDNVITDGWRGSDGSKASRAQRSYLSKGAKDEEGMQASDRLIVSLSHPVGTEQESTGSSGTLEDLMCDPTADRIMEINAERSLFAQKIEQVLNEALAKAGGLTDQRRIIIRLDARRVSEGYPLADKEIAEMLETDADTVKTQRSKGRKALTEYLGSQSAQDPSLKELIMEILSKRRSKRPKAPGGS